MPTLGLGACFYGFKGAWHTWNRLLQLADPRSAVWSGPRSSFCPAHRDRRHTVPRSVVPFLGALTSGVWLSEAFLVSCGRISSNEGICCLFCARRIPARAPRRFMQATFVRNIEDGAFQRAWSPHPGSFLSLGAMRRSCQVGGVRDLWRLHGTPCPLVGQAGSAGIMTCSCRA